MKNLLCLVMIVKDAESVIEDTLNAIKPIIDSYLILDTGSEDKTKEIIEKAMIDKRGKLISEPFIDFPTSRNRALELAGTECKYTIMLDDSYILNNPFALRKFLEKGKHDAYHICIKDDFNIYYSCRILKSIKKFRYNPRYRVHELIEYDGGLVLDYFNTGIFLLDNKDVASQIRTKKRQESDLKILLEDQSNFPEDKRIIYYLANTLNSLEKYDSAIEYYTKRIAFSDSVVVGKSKNKEVDEEVYMSKYIIASLSDEKLNNPFEECEKLYLNAYNYDSLHAEPLYRVGARYYQLGNYSKSFEYLEKAYKTPLPNRKMMQVEHSIYFLEIPYLFAEVAERVGKKNLALTVISKLKKLKPDCQRVLNLFNTLTSKSKQEEIIKVMRYNKPLIVFHSGNKVSWNPDDLSKASGSEVAVMNMAKEYNKRDWLVYVFGDFESKDYFCENRVESIHYRSLKDYIPFTKKYYVNLLIVSRFTDNLVYFPNIEKVYLWLHDVIPQGNTFSTHPVIFKGVICLSNFHKQIFCKEYKFPEDLVIVSRNGIDEELYSSKIEKTPFRFIYTSAIERGLEKLLDYWPAIKEKYPSATLYLFIDGNKLSPTLKKKITEGVIIRERVDQATLAKEFLKSDIWFYPTNFEETYCISALEAQISGTLCVCPNIGSLPEIVGNRGIVYPKGENPLKKLFYLLDNREISDLFRKKGRDWAENQTYSSLVEEWIKLL